VFPFGDEFGPHRAAHSASANGRSETNFIDIPSSRGEVYSPTSARRACCMHEIRSLRDETILDRSRHNKETELP
jgi:hypothetical protein